MAGSFLSSFDILQSYISEKYARRIRSQVKQWILSGLNNLLKIARQPFFSILPAKKEPPSARSLIEALE
jgi:hypothetical protein